MSMSMPVSMTLTHFQDCDRVWNRNGSDILGFVLNVSELNVCSSLFPSLLAHLLSFFCFDEWLCKLMLYNI